MLAALALLAELARSSRPCAAALAAAVAPPERPLQALEQRAAQVVPRLVGSCTGAWLDTAAEAQDHAPPPRSAASEAWRAASAALWTALCRLVQATAGHSGPTWPTLAPWFARLRTRQ